MRMWMRTWTMLIQFIIVQIILLAPKMSWHKIAYIDPTIGLVVCVCVFLLFVVARWLSFCFYLWSHLYCVQRRPQLVIMCTMHLFLYVFLFHSCCFFIPFIHFIYRVLFYISRILTAQFSFTFMCISRLFFFSSAQLQCKLTHSVLFTA